MKLQVRLVTCSSLLSLALSFWGCESNPPPGASAPSEPAAERPPAEPGLPTLAPPSAVAVPSNTTEGTNGEAPPTPETWLGPFFHVTGRSIGIYATPAAVREQKIGYAQEGSRLAVNAEPVSKTGCPAGWYELIGGGFVCGKDGTLNPNDERAKFPPRQPNLDAVLPYVYARNAHNGTPLYRSVPSREQIRTYEPYLFKDENKPSAPPVPATKPAAVEVDEATRKAREEQKRRTAAMRLAMLGPEAARKLEEEERREGKSVPVSAQAPASGTDTDGGAPQQWWQQEDPKLHELKLADLHAEGDDVLSKRMVKGFYIAVERQFGWSGRQWYRSTSGGIAPVDRFYQAAGPEFRGVELNEGMQLPIAWPYGHAKTKPKYTLDAELTTARSAGVVKRLEAIALTGKSAQIGKATYLETVDGFWVKRSDVRVTEPGPPPADLTPDERWIDVNLATQSVVLFRGTTPLYATLISSGKESSIKEKDHRTPVGEYRIREKHVTATMDGDGSAAGDLPYSIEAVPYVMYYQGSYALHGAFWHGNYGVRMSHGCVNLSPLDAKYLFFNSDPPVPAGWAGSWSLADRPGSRVVVHE